MLLARRSPETTPNEESGEWPAAWTYSSDKPEVLVDKVVKKVKDALSGQAVAKITLRDNGIYVGKHTVGGREYATAIYSRKKEISSIKKVVVSSLDELQADSIKRHLYCENTYIKYLVLAFYEEGETEPSLVVQAAKNALEPFSSQHLEAWMRYLGVMGEEKKNESEEEIVLDKEGSWWVTQLDEPLFGSETCWGESCCNRAANKILENAGTSTNRAQQIVVAESSNSDCSGLTGKATEFREAVRIIDKSLKEHGLPIMVGVHHPTSIKDKATSKIIGWEETCSSNIPNFTNHYVIVKGKKYDNSKKQYYYLFYEVGTADPNNGKSLDNKLYIYDNLMKGTTKYKEDVSTYYYIVTEIRKNTDLIY